VLSQGAAVARGGVVVRAATSRARVVFETVSATRRACAIHAADTICSHLLMIQRGGASAAELYLYAARKTEEGTRQPCLKQSCISIVNERSLLLLMSRYFFDVEIFF